MSEAATPTPEAPAAAAFLAELAGLEMDAVRKVHGALMAATETDDINSLGRTFQRVSRCMRQTLHLTEKLAADRLRAEKAPRTTNIPRDDVRIELRAREVRTAVRRLIWATTEYDPIEAARDNGKDRQGFLLDLLDQKLETWKRANDFGLGPLNDQILEICLGFKLEVDAEYVACWPQMPDPDRPEDDVSDEDDEDWDDDEDEAQATPALTYRSSG